jgi:hypothetical protein
MPECNKWLNFVIPLNAINDNTLFVYHMCVTWSWRTYEMHLVSLRKSGVTRSTLITVATCQRDHSAATLAGTTLMERNAGRQSPPRQRGVVFHRQLHHTSIYFLSCALSRTGVLSFSEARHSAMRHSSRVRYYWGNVQPGIPRWAQK